MTAHRIRWGLGGLLLLATWGCGPGGPEIATVEGTIKMDGQPLPNAAVVFIPENGRPAGATTDENGHYVLNFTAGRKGAIPGKNTIRITTVRDAGEGPDGTPIPAQREKVPMKYNAATELTFDVKEGEANVADFNIESGGPISAAVD